jgi:hypothetical protein
MTRRQSKELDNRIYRPFQVEMVIILMTIQMTLLRSIIYFSLIVWNLTKHQNGKES